MARPAARYLVSRWSSAARARRVRRCWESGHIAMTELISPVCVRFRGPGAISKISSTACKSWAMDRMALVVGVNYYSDKRIQNLSGCVNDAEEVARLLKHNGDFSRSRNFDCKELYATGPDHAVNRAAIKDEARRLFQSKAEIALFYFSGHGHIESTGGFINGSDSTRGTRDSP